MAEPLYELLAPYLDSAATAANPTVHGPHDVQTASYLARLSTLSLSDLAATEPSALLQATQSHARNLQALAKRSHKAVIHSSTHLSSLPALIPQLQASARELKDDDIPALESAASSFAARYDRSGTGNAVLDRRKRAMLLARNVDRVSDVLDLPTLLSSTVVAAQGGAGGGSASAAISASTSYTSALDLQAHIKRLNALYPQSELIGEIGRQADREIQNMTSILISTLKSPQLKLAGAMRTIGWLRRVAPDLAGDGHTSGTGQSVGMARPVGAVASGESGDGALGSLFLVCRLHTLSKMLQALEPLRELAEQESAHLKQATNGGGDGRRQSHSSALGSQTERFLKRYIEIFREQSFNIISMYKSIFPADLPTPDHSVSVNGEPDANKDPLLPLPSPLASFSIHLTEMLTSTLEIYLPNVSDKSARESLLTQVLYCAGSLGRLGSEFGMYIALLEEDSGANRSQDDPASATSGPIIEPEWMSVMEKHRVQAGRLEMLARSVGGGRKGSADAGPSPTATPAAIADG